MVTRFIRGNCLARVGLAFSFALLGLMELRAAPVTLRFEATINTVFPGIPFDSGVDFAVGELVSEEFTFDPSPGSAAEISYSAAQPYIATLHIDGMAFRTPPSAGDLELLSSNNSFVTDYPPASVIDSITLGSSIGPQNADHLPNVSPATSSIRLSLRGDASILGAASHPAEVSIWNLFEFERQLMVGIRSQTSGVMGFQATVGQFAQVPEPPTSLMGFALLAAAAIRMLQGEPLATRSPHPLAARR
jgi:hypothetical protein